MKFTSLLKNTVRVKRVDPTAIATPKSTVLERCNFDYANQTV